MVLPPAPLPLRQLLPPRRQPMVAEGVATRTVGAVRVAVLLVALAVCPRLLLRLLPLRLPCLLLLHLQRRRLRPPPPTALVVSGSLLGMPPPPPLLPHRRRSLGRHPPRQCSHKVVAALLVEAVVAPLRVVARLLLPWPLHLHRHLHLRLHQPRVEVDVVRVPRRHPRQLRDHRPRRHVGVVLALVPAPGRALERRLVRLVQAHVQCWRSRRTCTVDRSRLSWMFPTS